jgi:hypothetical protein
MDASGGTLANIQARMVGAIRLQAATFEEVEHDRGATGQAALVVALAGLASGIGAIRYGSAGGVVFMIVTRLLGWLIGAFVLLIVGTKLLPGRDTEADLGQMLRTSGFAQAAGIFGILGIIPLLGGLLEILVGIWILVALVIAVRQALDYQDTARAIIVCAIAWVIMFLVTVVGMFFGFGAAVVSQSAF